MQEYNSLRAQFTEVHRELEAKVRAGCRVGGDTRAPGAYSCPLSPHPPAQRESYTSPAELKKEISQLNNERDQLEAKIEALKRKTKDLVRPAALYTHHQRGSASVTRPHPPSPASPPCWR